MDDRVNPQITDAVAQTNVKVVGEAPAESLALSTQAMAHSVSLAMENATHRLFTGCRRCGRGLARRRSA